MSGYIGTQPVPQATQHRETFTATASQTSFATAGYTPQFLDVFLNGIHLLNPDDYTASNGSDVVLTTGAALDDVLEVISYSTYEVNSQNYTGGLTVDNSAATVLTVDRAGSDGTIIDVQKNGSTVASIGNAGADVYFRKASGAGVYCSGTAVLPFGAHSLGQASDRWSDLYLSGGVYLGGTGSANKLDDVEEGTFSPTIDGWTGTYGRRDGVYTKIGNWVHCYGGVRTNGSTGSFSNDYPGVGGLPFNGGISVSAAMGYAHIVSGSTGIPSNKTSLLPLDGPGSGNSSAFPNWVGVGGDSGNFTKGYLSASSNVEYRFFISYRTT